MKIASFFIVSIVSFYLSDFASLLWWKYIVLYNKVDNSCKIQRKLFANHTLLPHNRHFKKSNVPLATLARGQGSLSIEDILITLSKRR